MSSSTTLRRGLVAALLPLGLLGLSACGSENATKASSPSTSTTASVPTDSGSEVDVQEFVDLMAASFDGASTATVRMELTGGPAAMSADGAIDYSASPPAMVLSVMMGDGAGMQEMEMRMVDEVVYLRSELTGPKFLALDAATATEQLGSSLTDQLDPRSMMADLESSIESVRVVGQDTVDGDEVTVYAVEMDSAAVAKQMGPDAEAADLPKTLTYEMAFDGDGHYRRMSVDLGDAAGAMEMTFSDWGEPVTIEAPPADQVTQMPGMG